ncbi:MAG: hypothetical protein AAFN93_29115 [Bacteroidota bacterium]
MPIKTYLTTSSAESEEIKIDDEEFLDILGPEEEAMAVKLEELFESITNTMASSVEAESKLTIEVTGSMTLKAKGGVQYLFFNAGAEASTVGTMKVTLSTTLQPS